ncbi:membrane-associated zinc metalloprotease [Desulfovibrio sp. X2]|uniref:RIP metalloprotease RseP n=1 Tax=Desulfovibrio sp. X2 TaxID=941449 RepID=UPI0003589E70|nr:RIP metalloprotease RseP [Desulfovibrio sp. X2]EPR44360.1 membrane-associated zinc metalloprotease [Desulfovibrio sp. X2]
MRDALAVILVLGGLIFFHELGHFILARVFGVGVRVFSLGFGPRLFGLRAGKTEYRLSLVPLGGYVSMVGEHPEEHPEGPADGSDDDTEGFEPHQFFNRKPAWQRMCIVAAGPCFNFLLAFLVYWALIATGNNEALNILVTTVHPDTPAAEAGLHPEDLITAVNNKPLWFGDELTERIKEKPDAPIHLTVERDGKTFAVDLTPRVMTRTLPSGSTVTRPMIGVSYGFRPVHREAGFAEAPVLAWRKFTALTGKILHGLWEIVTGAVSTKEIGGPIFIAQVVAESAKQGLATVLQMAAFLSVNLGLINLLPIPVLDGGHILFFGLEAASGKPVSTRVQGVTTRIGLFLLFMLMALAIYNDIVRSFFGPA